MWAEAATTILFGALAGGITNWIAVLMLFHPYEPRRLGLLTLQGAIPKNRARLAKSIGRTVGQRLLTEEDLARQLTAPGLRDAFDRALADYVERLLSRSWGPLSVELPPRVRTELESALEPLAEALARRIAAFVEGPAFDAALDRYVALERWVEDGVQRPELEAAVRKFLASQRDRLLRDERPLLDRLPRGLVDALEQAIADYLPIAVERLGALLGDPDARARIRTGLKKFLDRAVRNLMVHERVMAKLVLTERRLDRALQSLEGEGLAEIAEVFESAEFRHELARAINEAVSRFLRTPLADRLWALGPDRLDGLERAAADFVVGALRSPQTRAWAVARARDAVELARQSLAGERGRERVADVAQDAVRALLDRPIGRLADLLPPDAGARLREALSEPLWSWIRRQVPAVVSQLSVQEMVEQKVMGFSVQRMEELVKNVTERELRLIIQLGYVLGAFVGVAAFLVNQLF